MGYVNHLDYQSRYAAAKYGNIRYPSQAEGAIDGWAYALTKDDDYVRRLAEFHHHKSQGAPTKCA